MQHITTESSSSYRSYFYFNQCMTAFKFTQMNLLGSSILSRANTDHAVQTQLKFKQNVQCLYLFVGKLTIFFFMHDVELYHNIRTLSGNTFVHTSDQERKDQPKPAVLLVSEGRINKLYIFRYCVRCLYNEIIDCICMLSSLQEKEQRLVGSKSECVQVEWHVNLRNVVSVS